MWSKQPVSLVSDHHVDNASSTSESLVKSQKGKVRYPYLLCKDMHRTYLCPHMDEASNLLEDITVPQQQLPTGYHKLSLDLPFVDKVVDIVPSSVDPTLSLESEEQVVHPTLPLKSEVEAVDPSPSFVDPTLPSESEVKVVESISSPPNPTFSSESVKIEVVALTKF